MLALGNVVLTDLEQPTGSQLSFNGSPQNLNASFVWVKFLKTTFENFLPPLKICGGKPKNFDDHHQSEVRNFERLNKLTNK